MKFLLTFLFILYSMSAVFSFEWPVKKPDTENLVSTFAQNRRNFFNNSLIFPNAETASAADSGKIIAVISEHDGQGSWFESPLGNAVIISHDDKLISIYGNLTKKAADELEKKDTVTLGEELGPTGNSGWSENKKSNFIEFQIADTEGNTFINPLILMPRVLKPRRLLMQDVSVQNLFGRIYNLSILRSIPAGMYSVYKKRQADVVPYKTSVFVNGTELEKISKDALKAQDGRLVITGSDTYKSEEFYPNEGTELLGHILLPHGSNTITITISGILENENTASYVISCY